MSFSSTYSHFSFACLLACTLKIILHIHIVITETRYVLYLHQGTRLSGKVDIGHILAPQEGGAARGSCPMLDSDWQTVP